MEPAHALEVGGQARRSVVQTVGEGGQQGPCVGELSGQDVFAGADAVVGEGGPSVGFPGQVGQAQGWACGSPAVVPSAGVRVEAVVGQGTVTVGGDQVDGVDEVVADGVADEVVEVDADPAGFDAVAAEGDLVQYVV